MLNLLSEHPSCTQGEGFSGARKFKAILPFLRWHNPSAHIKQQWDLERPEPHVSIVLNNGESQEFAVKGKRVEHILQEVMKAAKAPEESIAPTVQWAEQFMVGRRVNEGRPHEFKRYFDEPEEAADADGDGDGDADVGSWSGEGHMPLPDSAEPQPEAQPKL